MSNQQNNPSSANSKKWTRFVTITTVAASIATIILAIYTIFPTFWNANKVFTVHVADQKGAPVSRASVLLLSDEVPSLNEHTDSKGLARFSIQSATLTNGNLIVEKEGFETYERAIDSPINSTIKVQLRELDPTSGHITLRIIDHQKNPLSNTEIQLFIDNNVYNQVADSNGIAKFRVPFSAQQIEALITAKNEGFEVKEQRITLWVNQTQDLLLNPETSEIEVVN